MAHPQGSPRGLFAKKNFRVPASGGVFFEDYSSATQLLTAAASGLKVAGGLALSAKINYLTYNTTGLVVPGQVRVSNAKYVGANSTGFIFTAAAAKPSTRSSAKWAFLTNSTGVNAVMLNTTGTTWKYLNVTSVLPT